MISYCFTYHNYMISYFTFLGEGWILLFSLGGAGIGTPRHHHLIVAANSQELFMKELWNPRHFFQYFWRTWASVTGIPNLKVMFGFVPLDFHEFPWVSHLIQEYMKQYALDNARKAGILNSERQNSLRLVRGIAESLPVGDQVADAEAWLWKSIIWGVLPSGYVKIAIENGHL